MNKRTKIDTRVRHVTKRGANLFADLGFPPSEAKRLQALSRAEIDQALQLKRQLMVLKTNHQTCC